MFNLSLGCVLKGEMIQGQRGFIGRRWSPLEKKEIRFLVNGSVFWLSPSAEIGVPAEVRQSTSKFFRGFFICASPLVQGLAQSYSIPKIPGLVNFGKSGKILTHPTIYGSSDPPGAGTF
ncbi:hypothetical protein TNCV_4713991 [Trichonephila clavipes]|nr:hypothetical protein TNCV_4713991 [Trichonephila clavipes]